MIDCIDAAQDSGQRRGRIGEIGLSPGQARMRRKGTGFAAGRDHAFAHGQQSWDEGSAQKAAGARYEGSHRHNLWRSLNGKMNRVWKPT